MPIDARKLQNRITIVIYGDVEDGLGGFTTEVTERVLRWAEVKNINNRGGQQDIAGIVQFQNTFQFTFRWKQNHLIEALRDNIEYKGERYLIQSVTNENIADIKTVVLATKITQPNS